LQKKFLRLIDYGLFAEESFVDLGKKLKNRKTFFRTLSSCKVAFSLPVK